MPRLPRAARAARRNLMMVNGSFQFLDEYETYESRYPCPYCDHPFEDHTKRDRHIMMKPECRAPFLANTEAGRKARREREFKIPGPSSKPHPLASGSGTSAIDDNGKPLRYNDPRQWSDNGRTCHMPYVERFPSGTAGSPISEDVVCARNLASYLESCGPLSNLQNMEAAELMLTTGLSGRARTRHLKSAFYKGKTPWVNSQQMMRDVDKLPTGPAWGGKVVGAGVGRYYREHVAYFRPVIDVTRELIGNPAFKDFMRYAPERHWTDRSRRSRIYSETWTGNWWWRRQKFLRDKKGTIVPVIFATDKTQMTKLSGNQSAYPVYMTIGNISKSIRSKSSKHATVIVGYLPVDSFADVPQKALRQRLVAQLIHYSMSLITAPLEEAGRTGVEMWCADGRLRRVYPLLAAFVGDYPEQCLMGCAKQSGCPKCLKRGPGKGDERRAPPRTTQSTLLAIDNYLETRRVKTLEALGLKRWWPWWANLPYVQFAASITPDLLHQVHKGVFKDHAMRWMQRKLGKPVVDERMASMTRAKNLRHFKRGISVVKQWTGREAKEMEKTFVPLLAEDPNLSGDLVAFIRALIDFSYIARAARLTDTELDELDGAWNEMQRLKQVLVDSKIYPSLRRLDGIHKWHQLSHYHESIRNFGTPDGYNTEAPEYLHIVYVKRGWAASNKRDAIPQIIDYCQRLEALRIHRAHLDEYYGIERRRQPTATAVFVADEKGSYEPEEDGDDHEDEEDDWEDDEDMEDDGDEGELGPRRATSASGASVEVDYPWPELAIAIKPTCRVTLAELVNHYGATSLESALKSFLRPYARNDWFILPHDQFSSWHKLTLYHHPLRFAPDEPRHRDVIRVRPPQYDKRGRRLRHIEPVFDTALYLYDSRQFGLCRYRAGRVRAIFRLPERLHYMYSGELVYLELFTTFNANPLPSHLLHATSHAKSDRRRQCIVVPIEDVVLGCHLAPNFRRINRNIQLDSNIDLLSDTRHFFFNHYYNLYTFQLIQYWRHFHPLGEE
ncbi:hypothetical protein FRC09_019797 [Ceratobasidium sp. 395]|nr:hypothetical protein FRC09_019797 [Ceratobasidium sp. 395]